MKGKIECILSSAFSRPLSFALLLISSLVLSSLSPLYANAASVYDSVLNYQPNPTLSCYEGGSNYTTPEAVATTWLSLFNGQDQIDGYQPYTTNQTIIDALSTLNDRISDGSGYALTSWYSSGVSGGLFLVINKNANEVAYFSDTNTVENNGLELQVNNSYGLLLTCHNQNGGQARMYLHVIFNGRTPIGSSVGFYGSQIQQSMINMQVDYPSGYEGQVIPDSLAGEKTKIKPEFTYSVNNKDVQAKDFNQTLPTITPDEGYTIQGYSVGWSLFECGSYTEVGNTCNDPNLVKYQVLPQDDNFNYSVNNYGDYHLQAQYLVQECYRYSSYPATPDYCFYVDFGAEADLEDYDFTSTTVRLKIDGSSFSGDTREGECDVSGFCEQPSPYEDCSTYGLDIVGGLGCVIRNFGVWLTNTLKMLFIPTGQFFNELFSDFGDFFNEKLGFIAYPITFLIGFFNDLMNAASSPTCQMEGGSIFGVNADIDLCTMQDKVPVIYNGIITFIRAAVAFTLIFALFRKYHEIVGEGGKA